uniref:Na(+)/H(+) exchange regulatory cofactor NHE-RF1 n=1 Tax=Buteo japonicus TaxID=224669 RepID=A0A8C0BC81_9AVES
MGFYRSVGLSDCKRVTLAHAGPCCPCSAARRGVPAPQGPGFPGRVQRGFHSEKRLCCTGGKEQHGAGAEGEIPAVHVPGDAMGTKGEQTISEDRINIKVPGQEYFKSGHPRIVFLPPKQASGGPGAVPGCRGVREQLSHRLSPLQEELRPRLCCMKKGPNGYGFNLHSDKSRPGQYVRAIDPDSPAEAAGLAPQDRIIEVNGVCMEGKQHADVVAAIKAGGDETRLLVVDVLTDEFFKKCKVVPSEEHLAGPLPEPVANGDLGKVRDPHLAFNPICASLQSGTPPLWGCPGGGTAGLMQPLPPQPDTQEGDKRHSASGSLLDLDIPLAVAKERAHQKRTSKRAPQMDWSKKNELFSNL